MLFKVEIITVASQLEALAHAPYEVVAQARPHRGCK